MPRVVLAQLGTGDAVRGEQLVERLIGEMRSRRVLMTSRARSTETGLAALATLAGQ